MGKMEKLSKEQRTDLENMRKRQSLKRMQPQYNSTENIRAYKVMKKIRDGGKKSLQENSLKIWQYR